MSQIFLFLCFEMKTENPFDQDQVKESGATACCDNCGFNQTIVYPYLDDNSLDVKKRRRKAQGTAIKDLQTLHRKRCNLKLNSIELV